VGCEGRQGEPAAGLLQAARAWGREEQLRTHGLQPFQGWERRAAPLRNSKVEMHLSDKIGEGALAFVVELVPL